MSEYFWQYSAYGLKWDLIGIETVRAAVVVACAENKQVRLISNVSTSIFCIKAVTS